MHIDEYITTQNTLGTALNSTAHETARFKLFSAIFSEQIDVFRAHIQEQADAFAGISLHDFERNSLERNAIEKNVRAEYQLQVQDGDFDTAAELNHALSASQLSRFRLLLCTKTHPLSLHNDPTHIDQEVVANCSFITQQRLKENSSFDSSANSHYLDYDGANDEDVIEQPQLLHDLIKEASSYQGL